MLQLLTYQKILYKQLVILFSQLKIVEAIPRIKAAKRFLCAKFGVVKFI